MRLPVNIPFLISDILERIIPGFFALACVLFLAGFNVAAIGKIDSFLLIGIAFVFSYVLGVVFNVISNTLPFLETRYSVDVKPEYLEIVSEKFQNTFGFSFGSDSWRYCYGIVSKDGMAVNTSFFAGMIVFCKSMFVGSAVVAIFSFVVLIHPVILNLSKVGSAFSLLMAVAVALVFVRGARIYGRSFTLSILDAFVTWATVGKKQF
jgi:hypothetical protein